MASMLGGRGALLSTISKSFSSPSLPLRSSAVRPQTIRFSATSNSSKAYNDARDDERATEKAIEAVYTTEEAAQRAKEKAKEGAKSMGEKMKDTANKAGEKASHAKERATDRTTETAKMTKDKTKEETSTVVETAQNLGEMAKHTVQDAWGAAKEATQKIKETVVGKMEEKRDDAVENHDDARNPAGESSKD